MKRNLVTDRCLILLACMLMTFVLGSVHSFSVFLVPLEQRLDLPRSDISLIYSWALVAITFSVLVGYRVYARLDAWIMLLLIGALAALGLSLTVSATSWWHWFIGYSGLFGLANGMGYGYCLQLVGHELSRIKGFAMGAVTASYALGSILFAKVFAWRIGAAGVESALLALMYMVMICSVVAALFLWWSRSRFPDQSHQPETVGSPGKIFQFWFAYFCSVFAGLMAIGHAAGMVLWKELGIAQATLGAMMIGVGSASGGFLAGWMIDRWSISRFLVGLPLLAAVAMLFLLLTSDIDGVILLLSVIGFSYGSIIAVYPVAISRYFADAGPRVYGRVFTAWGVAGLSAPWFAGLIFDVSGSYASALILAALISLVSAASAAICRFDNAV